MALETVSDSADRVLIGSVSQRLVPSLISTLLMIE